MFDYIIMKQIFTGLVILGLLSKGMYTCREWRGTVGLVMSGRLRNGWHDSEDEIIQS